MMQLLRAEWILRQQVFFVMKDSWRRPSGRRFYVYFILAGLVGKRPVD